MEHWLVKAAAMHPDRLAVNGLSYEQLLANALGAAAALRQRGVGTGDRVALALAPDEHFVVALHGCLLAGAIAVPIDLRLGEAERGRRARGAAVVVDQPLERLTRVGPGVEAERQPAFDPVRLALDAVATIMHTSGTTAEPSAVPLTYGNWLASALGSAVALGLDPAERWLCPMPLAHVGGLSIPIRSSIYGTSAIVHGFEVEAVLAALSDPAQRITLVSLVPTMLSRLLDAGLREPPTLRWVLLGGGPIAPALLTRAADAGVPIATTYGMTEACSQIATHGWPLPAVDVRVAADGELLVRGPTVSPETADKDGWLHTGDLGELDPSGRLRIVGRKSETIVSGGENVAPGEVESVLLEHPAVADAAVFGRPDGEWGERVLAAVVVRRGQLVGAQELRAHCARLLAGFKVPKEIEFRDSLPRTISGKIIRRAL